MPTLHPVSLALTLVACGGPSGKAEIRAAEDPGDAEPAAAEDPIPGREPTPTPPTDPELAVSSDACDDGDESTYADRTIDGQCRGVPEGLPAIVAAYGAFNGSGWSASPADHRLLVCNDACSVLRPGPNGHEVFAGLGEGIVGLNLVQGRYVLHGLSDRVLAFDASAPGAQRGDTLIDSAADQRLTLLHTGPRYAWVGRDVDGDHHVFAIDPSTGRTVEIARITPHETVWTRFTVAPDDRRAAWIGVDDAGRPRAFLADVPGPKEVVAEVEARPIPLSDGAAEHHAVRFADDSRLVVQTASDDRLGYASIRLTADGADSPVTVLPPSDATTIPFATDSVGLVAEVRVEGTDDHALIGVDFEAIDEGPRTLLTPFGGHCSTGEGLTSLQRGRVLYENRCGVWILDLRESVAGDEWEVGDLDLDLRTPPMPLPDGTLLVNIRDTERDAAVLDFGRGTRTRITPEDGVDSKAHRVSDDGRYAAVSHELDVRTVLGPLDVEAPGTRNVQLSRPNFNVFRTLGFLDRGDR